MFQIGTRREGEHGDHHVDVVVFADDFHRLAEYLRLTGGQRGHVRRIADLAVTGNQLTEAFVGGRRVVMPAQAQMRADVGHLHHIAAGQ